MSESHNDIEQLCEALVNAQRDLECLELNYVGAPEEHMPWLRQEHERCVYAEHEADGMLDAALDEVFEQTFDMTPVYVKPKCSFCQNVHAWGCGYCEDYDPATE
jgi:hypothetical protein